jgi:hypothetical protein
MDWSTDHLIEAWSWPGILLPFPSSVRILWYHLSIFLATPVWIMFMDDVDVSCGVFAADHDVVVIILDNLWSPQCLWKYNIITPYPCASIYIMWLMVSPIDHLGAKNVTRWKKVYVVVGSSVVSTVVRLGSTKFLGWIFTRQEENMSTVLFVPRYFP